MHRAALAHKFTTVSRVQGLRLYHASAGAQRAMCEPVRRPFGQSRIGMQQLRSHVEATLARPCGGRPACLAAWWQVPQGCKTGLAGLQARAGMLLEAECTVIGWCPIKLQL